MSTTGVSPWPKVRALSKLSTGRGGKILLIGIVALQVATPAFSLLHEPPTRLGWQMYSGNGELPKIIVESTNGAEEDIPFTDLAATSRAELNWDHVIPAYVCGQMEDAATVRLIYPSSTESFGCP